MATAEAIVDVDGTPMQGVIAKLSRTPGAIRWSASAPTRPRSSAELQDDAEDLRAVDGREVGSGRPRRPESPAPVAPILGGPAHRSGT